MQAATRVRVIRGRLQSAWERHHVLPSKRTRVEWTPWVLVGPVLAIFVVFFAIPVVILLASSLQRLDTATLKVVDGFTLFNYTRFLLDEFYFGVLVTTLKISLLVTLTCVIFGYPVAAYLSMAGSKERGVLMLLVISPLLVSLVIRSFGWLIILGPRGVVNSVLLALGIVAAPVRLIHPERRSDRLGASLLPFHGPGGVQRAAKHRPARRESRQELGRRAGKDLLESDPSAEHAGHCGRLAYRVCAER